MGAGVPERIEGLAIDPTSSNHVIAYGVSALRSADRGATWSAAETFPPNLQKVLFDTRRTAVLYAVDFINPTLFRSADNGNTWESRPLPATGFVTDLAQDSAGHLWIAQGPENDNTDTAPYRSTDGGDTWERVDTGLPDGVAIRSFGPGPDGRMAAGTSAHGVYILQNGPCQSNATTACLLDGKFRVEASQRPLDDPSTSVVGRVMHFDTSRAESEQSVFFESFQDGNFEVGVKMVDACGLPTDDPLRSYWVFYGGLTNVGSQVVVTQVDTGATDTWTVFAGVLPRSEGRVSAFACE